MAVRKRVADKKRRKVETYLTKRIVARAARKAINDAAEKAMTVMGFTIVAQGEWIIKKYADGKVEKVTKITHVNRRRKIVLD